MRDGFQLILAGALLLTTCGLFIERIEDPCLLAADITMVRVFDTWNGGVIPSTDAAGIGYHTPSGHLYVADSEINELPDHFVGDNIFEIDLRGDTLIREIASGNSEPTGITYNGFDGFFYVTNDNSKRLTRYDSNFDGILASVKTTDVLASATDPEGVTSDASNGLLYVVDGSGGAKQVLVFGADLQFRNSFSVADQMVDAEGIALHHGTGNLFIVSDPQLAIFEYTVSGEFVQQYDISSLSPTPRAPQGLTFAPTSDPNDDPDRLALYIADGGRDNQPDGRVYETVLVSADFDHDGDVDGDDFLIWQTGLGIASGATRADGDSDGDGDVDGDDFLVWQSALGSGSGSAIAAVPEPASIVLLVAILVGAIFVAPFSGQYGIRQPIRELTNGDFQPETY